MAHDLAEMIAGLGRPRVLVVGDAMLDRYTFGAVERISPEAPVPVLRATEQRAQLGGAASVAAMLACLEADVVLAGVVGDDEAGREVRAILRRLGSSDSCLLVDPGRPTTVKHRYIGGAGDRKGHQMLRVDVEVRTPLSAAVEANLLAALETQWANCDIILVSEYGKGVCTQGLLTRCVERARSRGIRVLVDPPPCRDYTPYAGSSCLTPNRHETQLSTGIHIETPEQALAAGELLLRQLNAEAMVITLDREGMALVHRDGRRKLFPTRQRQVYDVTGAGDMVLSVLGISLAAGFDYEDAIILANIAAGLEVERVGVATLTRAELLADVEVSARVAPPPRLDKTPARAALLGELQRRRQLGQTIVFTNGCFDILHAGHIQCLKKARELGDFLVVGLNSDASIRRLKGEGRPLHNAHDRAEVLAALECVDAVVVFEEDTPLQIIEAVRPNVLAKGADYQAEQVVGRDFVEAQGGRLVLIPLVQGLSSTRLRPHIR